MKSLTRIPPIHNLIAFEAASRFGSFERAAEELCVSSSAVSHRVRSLEHQLSIRLFTRTDRGVRLTVHGREYLETVRTAIAALSDYPGHRREATRKPAVRVGVPPTFARKLLVPRLSTFYSRFPDTEIELILSIPFLDLKAEETDIDVRFGSGDYPDGEVLPLLDEPVFAACAPDYAQAIGPFRRPSDLARAVLLRSPLEPWRTWFKEAGLDWSEPARGPRYNDLGMLTEAAVAGQGVALARGSLVDTYLRSGALQILFDIYAASPYAYYLVRSRDVATRPEVSQFSNWLIESVRSVASQARQANVSRLSPAA